MTLAAMATPDLTFVEVLLPLALDRTYTYSVPADLKAEVAFGKRVEVQFGSRKRYAGLMVRLHVPEPVYKTKEIISVLDEKPVLLPWQWRIWEWMASYYACTTGEVMRAALPGGLMLSSETIIRAMPVVSEDEILQLDDPLFSIFNAIRAKDHISLDELEQVTVIKSLYPHIVRLYQLGMIVVFEALAEKYTPRKIKLVCLANAFADEDGMHKALEQISRSEKQTQVLLNYLVLTRHTAVPVSVKQLLDKSGERKGVIDAMVKKGVFTATEKEINRMAGSEDSEPIQSFALSAGQTQALQKVYAGWKEHEVVLLHGVTGSGKTILYTELIRETIEAGGQVLYMVPEIGLSVQILRRLKDLFGQKITISHSRLTDNERVDLWHHVMSGIPIVAGVRSSIFLPFPNLKLIIVDEEHDTSYKQQDPSPRYNARDMAIAIGRALGAKVILGSATPSIESYYHSETGKYARVEMLQRYQDLELPKVILIDKRKDKSAAGALYSHTLIEAIQENLAAKKQVIIYKNRRGYAPVMKCGVCQWVAECDQCDVALTYHKGRNVLACHICGTSKPLMNTCPACGSPRLNLEGYGTEKIEDELNAIFPEARIRRMDLDTTRGKHNMENLIQDFEEGNIDILVGTQMVTKGLDFDHVGLVGVIYADQALHFPDFRAVERTFQTLVQVSGRAGRKHQQGTVMIQTFQPDHPVLQDVVHGDYVSFYQREIMERETFLYPPFVRQIAITIRHPKPDISREAAQLMVVELQQKFGRRILGPSVPTVGRVRNQYLHMIYSKVERDGRQLAQIKEAIRLFQNGIVKRKSLTTVRISVDVDPLQ